VTVASAQEHDELQAELQELLKQGIQSNAETLNGLQGCSRAVPMESLMPAAKSQIACEQINIDLVDWDAFFYGAWIGGHR
jgi:hypothetical protein